MNDLTDCEIEPLRQDGELALARVARPTGRASCLLVSPVLEQPAPACLVRLENAFALREELDSSWAARPVELVTFRGRLALVMEDPDGEFLDRKIDGLPAVPDFLQVAISIASSLRGLHEKGLVHKDVKPANIIVNTRTGEAWLTGFGLTSRLPRHRQALEPPEIIAGTLAYMAPEQTGRMNRSIDSRSDLYSLGITFYEMLVGALPFNAGDPMEWVHCHIARPPVEPSLRRTEVPGPLSRIILKLLAKAPEERYQTAAGVEADLRRCLSAWEAYGRIEAFSLAARDVPSRLLVPERLYGREKEIELLLTAFGRVASQGASEFVLVSGYSGVGKSSVVFELHKVLVAHRGLVASGKFDQYKRDIPYATLAQAFGPLVRQILAKSDADVARWRESLKDALGQNGQLIVNLIPEIELIIGKSPPVLDLPPQEAKNRFLRILRRFIGVFARPEHPLALFLDDLQWLDSATLELIEHLAADPEFRHVLLVGAYRDNEVDPGHPLMRTLQKIRAAGTRVHDIGLSPLELDDLTALVGDALCCHADHCRPLAQLVHEKTGGNPFFAIQFITALAEENLVAFDSAAAVWKWDLASILAKGYTDNVVELMIAKLNRLPEATQNSLRQLACVGNSAETATLNLIYGEAEEELHAALWEAVRLGLASRSDNTYSFAHDRIQQAAYSQILDEHRGNVHLRIGRVLLQSMVADQLAEHLFDVANQLNRGAALLIDHDEKMQVATIHLRAGRKAKASAAYASALAYFSAGMALLDETDWIRHYELTFSLWLECAECEFLTGDFDKAEQVIGALLPRGATKVDKAAVYYLKVQLHVMKSDYQQAVSSAITCLQDLGIDLPAQPTQEQAQAEFETLGRTLGARSIESLIDLPLLSDPELQAAMRLFTVMTPPAYFTGFNVAYLLCRQVNISIQHGMSGDSAYACACLATILGRYFHRYDEGFRFAKLAGDLVEKHGFLAHKAKVFGSLAIVSVWTQSITTAIDFAQTSFLAASEAGDPAIACIGMFTSITNLLVRNDPLDSVSRESDVALDFARKAKYQDATDTIVSQQRFIRAMQGRTATFSTFNDAEFDEAAFEAQFAGGKSPMTICWYWILKLKARFLSGDFADAVAAADKAKPWLDASAGQIQQVDYIFYAALAMSALYDSAPVDQQTAWREVLTVHSDQLRECAENYPPTFADKHALVSAEIARIESRDTDAMRLYEHAIRSAREHGFVQSEGVAYEVAARFHAARGFETIADAYLRNARYCYLRWGATGKVRQLDEQYPLLRQERIAASSATAGPSVGQLDVETVVKASQALSSEMVLPNLIEKLMGIAVENAGAERGLLILLRSGEPQIEAKATTGEGGVQVTVRQSVVTPSDLPQSVLHYAIRTQQRVLLDDASTDSVYLADEYVRQNRSKSVLCLPIVKQAQTVGALYLENNLASHAFTPDRAAVLDVLASQAAISLENAALFTDLQLQVGLLQHLPVSTWTLKPDGTPEFVNQVWLEFAGQTLDFVRSHPAAWITAVHPEDREMAAKIFWEGVHSGQGFAIETRSLRARDATYRWHLQRAVVLRDSEGRVLKFVGATTDIDDQKRAEEALRRTQADLAHVERVATLNAMTASITHEISQPLSGILTNANTCLRMLTADPTELSGVAETVRRTIRDANRAIDMIQRLRAMFSKNQPTMEMVDLNDAAREVIALSAGELRRGRALVQTHFADGLPVVSADRVQLQQVILNLLLNAADAMEEVEDRPRALLVKTDLHGDGNVELAVRDSGPGVDPHAVEKLFEAFYTTKAKGMGVGLSICRSIIESHGGRLWASPNDGPGATFSFCLPRATPDSA